MKKEIVNRMILPVILLAGVLAVGCSENESSENEGLAGQIIDTATQAIVDGFLATKVDAVEDSPMDESSLVTVNTHQVFAESGIDIDESGSVSEMIVVGSKLFTLYNGKLNIYNLKTDEYDIIDSGDDLKSIGLHNDKIFVGGESLYRVDNNRLTPVEVEVKGTITSLTGYGPSLMIGTCEGLFAKNMLGTISLMEDTDITTLVSTGDALWVGTAGSGLFRWDGEKFKKRYLSRDESLFDNVTTLEYGHNHLYVGTDDALYIYDGGRWKTITIDDGLPSNKIRSVDPSGWTVYIGTTAGVVSYFENEFSPVTGFSNKGVSKICRVRGKLVAATFTEGILMTSGPSVKTLFNPTSEEESELASMVH